MIAFRNVYHTTKKKKKDPLWRGGHLDDLCDGAMYVGVGGGGGPGPRNSRCLKQTKITFF